MKKLLALILFALPVSAQAGGHMDVIQVTLNEGCSVAQYVAIAHDFNESFGKAHGYHTEILAPLQSQDLTAVFWVGRSASAAAFGAAWDAWRDALPDASSVPAKLQARFDKCSTNQSRRSYDIY
jgi:hypothetical protein